MIEPELEVSEALNSTHEGVMDEFKSFLVKSKKEKEKHLTKNLSNLLNMHIKPKLSNAKEKSSGAKSLQGPNKDAQQALKDPTQAEKVNNLLFNLKRKMKLTKNSRDVRFENKMKDFHNIYSFFDVRKFLENMNLVNKDSDINSYINNLRSEGVKMPSIQKITFKGPGLEEDSEIENSKEFLIKKRGERVLEKANISLQEASMKRMEKQEKLRAEMTQYLIGDEGGLMDMDLDLNDPRFDEILLYRIKQGKLVSQTEEKKKVAYRDPAKEKAQISELEKVIKAEMSYLGGKNFNEEVMEGRYYEFFKEQAKKIRKMLAKASKNIYNKKSEKIDLITKEENQRISNINPRKTIVIKRNSEKSGELKSVSFHRNFSNYEKKPTALHSNVLRRKVKSEYTQSTLTPDHMLDGNNTNTTNNSVSFSQHNLEHWPHKPNAKGFTIEIESPPTLFVTENESLPFRHSPSPLTVKGESRVSLPRIHKTLLIHGSSPQTRLFKKIKERTEAKRETKDLKNKMDKFIDHLNLSHEEYLNDKKEHLKELDALVKESQEAASLGKAPDIESLRDFNNFRKPAKYIDLSKLKNKGVLY